MQLSTRKSKIALNKRAMELNQTQFNAAIEKIVTALKTAGYDPYAQLTGYVETGQENYITRQGDAREMVLRLDVEQIKDSSRHTINNSKQQGAEALTSAFFCPKISLRAILLAFTSPTPQVLYAFI